MDVHGLPRRCECSEPMHARVAGPFDALDGGCNRLVFSRRYGLALCALCIRADHMRTISTIVEALGISEQRPYRCDLCSAHSVYAIFLHPLFVIVVPSSHTAIEVEPHFVTCEKCAPLLDAHDVNGMLITARTLPQVASAGEHADMMLEFLEVLYTETCRRIYGKMRVEHDG